MSRSCRKVIGWVRRIGLVAAFAGCLAATSLTVATPAFADTTTFPSVTQQPDISVVADAGTTGTFTARADGSPAPGIQWQEAPGRDGPWTSIPGATDAKYSVAATTSNLGHAFRAVFTNDAGTTVTRPATLVSKKDWMWQMRDQIGNVPLPELTIPGSHDTGTFDADGNGHTSTDHLAVACESSYSSDAICQSYAKAQDRSILQQLDDGIRYFDLRVCGSQEPDLTTDPPSFTVGSEHPVTCHELVSATLDKVLFQTRTWLNEHPREVVIMDFNHHFVVDPDMEAAQVEAAFRRDDGTSMLIQPPLCPGGGPNPGLCANTMTLNSIWNGNKGNVIVNFEDDGAPGPDVCINWPTCDRTYKRRPQMFTDFYDSHPSVWGRTDADPNSMEYCTVAAAFASCFANSTDRFTTLKRSMQQIDSRGTFAEAGGVAGNKFQHMYVQFLQMTPNAEYIRENLDGSLLDMSEDSNPIVIPHIFGCGDWQIYDCWAAYRPENINIVATNFYERTDDGGIHVDFVREALKFDEYARTAPVVTVSAPVAPGANGWYNAAILGGQGHTIDANVKAVDYWYGTGISTLGCADHNTSIWVDPTSPTSDDTATGHRALGDGVHLLECRATDGANQGLHGSGNSGAGPGSTPAVTFKVDTTPPVIRCPNGSDASFTLNQPVTTLKGSVTDATSGVASTTASASASTAAVGTFTAPLTATDVAGNTATVTCTYTVTYSIGYGYDTSRTWNAGATIPIMVQLQDWFGHAVGSSSIPLTAVSVTNTTSKATSAPTQPGNSRSQVFAYATGTGYRYNLNTKGLSPGGYTLDFTAPGDPITHPAPFAIQ